MYPQTSNEITWNKICSQYNSRGVVLSCLDSIYTNIVGTYCPPNMPLLVKKPSGNSPPPLNKSGRDSTTIIAAAMTQSIESLILTDWGEPKICKRFCLVDCFIASYLIPNA